MAAFRLKLTGLVGAPWGLVFQIPDAAMARILKSARAAYGKVLVDPEAPPVRDPPMRDMTDAETAVEMFRNFTKGWIDQAFINERSLARVSAEGAVVKDPITSETPDNT